MNSRDLHADIIFAHNGATNPLTEGFTNSDPGVGVTTGGIVNDLGTGLDAWFVDDDSLALGSAVIYRSSTMSSSNVANAINSGWRLSVNLRVVEGPSAGVFDGLNASFVTGSLAFGMSFDMEIDNDPTVTLFGGTSFTLEGAGSGDYHLYELIYDPSESSADLFVDGTERISGYAGSALSAPARINWGGNASSGTGRGHFNSVQFSVVPEPTSLFALGIGLAASTLTRRRPLIST